jgi:hypothetical protein
VLRRFFSFRPARPANLTPTRSDSKLQTVSNSAGTVDEDIRCLSWANRQGRRLKYFEPTLEMFGSNWK